MFVRACLLILALSLLSIVAVTQSTIPMSASQGVVDPSRTSLNNRFDAMSLSSVSGVVIGMDGRPLSNAVIQLQDVDSGSVLTSVQSSVNGAFSFSNIPVGNYEVVANLGVDQAHERVRCSHSDTPVILRLNTASTPEPGSGNTVSVKSLRVPDKARSAFQKAREAFQKSKFQDAWAHVGKALAAVPNYAQALTLRGLLRVHNGDRSGAEQDFQASIKDDSSYALAYFAMGAAQNVDGRYEEAQQTIEQGLRVDPSSWQGYFELSKALLGRSDYRNALKYAVKAESFETNYAPIHMVKAHALLGLRFYDEAATELERYLKLDPNGAHSADAQRSLQQARAFTTTDNR
jgi:Flp pilus assembly protein TadD